MPTSRTPTYKDLTLHQLRSLCETAHAGSFAAAATALEVSHPTVWKQVHALEKEFGVQLVETHRRGCQLTGAGRLLVEMAGPSVESILTLRERFLVALQQAGTHLTVALTPRTLVEDLASFIVKFRSQSPDTRFTFHELSNQEVAVAVQERRADFGFSPTVLTEDQQRLLTAEPIYYLEVRLLAPKDHPLARRRRIHPRDLRAYPLVNGPSAFASANIRTVLERYGAYQPEKCLAQVDYVASIRRFVELGFGIGLISVVPTAAYDSHLHECSLSGHFGHVPINLIQRRGAFLPAPAEAFIKMVQQELGSGR